MRMPTKVLLLPHFPRDSSERHFDTHVQWTLANSYLPGVHKVLTHNLPTLQSSVLKRLHTQPDTVYVPPQSMSRIPLENLIIKYCTQSVQLYTSHSISTAPKYNIDNREFLSTRLPLTREGHHVGESRSLSSKICTIFRTKRKR